jgi:hypothetical protein
MSLIFVDALQKSRAKLANSKQISLAEVKSNKQIESIRGRLFANLQAARSSSFIALLNNQSNS